MADIQGEYKFTDEQNQLRTAVCKFSADHFAEDKIRALMDSDPPFDPKVWARLNGVPIAMPCAVPCPSSCQRPSPPASFRWNGTTVAPSLPPSSESSCTN